MRVLFIAYCFGSYKGQALIGVYKRCLRIGMELDKRGHEVVMFCTNRTAYQDDLTEKAEKRIRFVDIPFSIESCEAAEKIRSNFLKTISQINPDLVVSGEAPLAGAMLEATLCAVELEIPVVFLDNAYNPLFAKQFCENHGAMADGIILTGPLSYQTTEPPAYLCQVPPYIEISPQLTGEFLTGTLGLKGEKLITIMAYDGKVEKLGISLLKKLCLPGLEFLFLSRNPGKCRRELKNLPGQIKKKVRVKVIPPPTDPILFGLLALSRFSVVKHGFMQVTECMALGTPVIVVYYEGPRWLDFLPEECRPFAFFTERVKPDAAILETARRYLSMAPIEMAGIHNGEFAAAARSADFLESLPRKQREGTWKECLNMGFKKAHFIPVFESLHHGEKVNPFLLRGMRLRNLPGYQMYSIICGYYLNGKKQFLRLWGRVYSSKKTAEENFQEEYSQESKRQVYYFSAQDFVLIEADIGQAMLPPL